MPACRDCPWFNAERSVCTIGEMSASSLRRRPDPPARYCLSAIYRKRLPHFRGNVLEIGPGATKTPRKSIRRRCTWHGVDPQYTTNEKNKAWHGVVTSLPFSNSMFEHVMAFECMEHWSEYGSDEAEGIAEIARVLKSGGTFLCTAPMHFHGSKAFVFGDRRRILSWFKLEHWSAVETEDWRKDHAPLPASQVWKTGSKWQQSQVIRYSDQPGGPSAWTMEIYATRR